MKKERDKQGLRLVSLQAARTMIGELTCCGLERVNLNRAGGRVAGEDIVAHSDCPSLDSSLKDGFAVQARDIAHANHDKHIRLKLAGTITAGQQASNLLESGQAIRIMTGAPIPQGADAVLASEFASQEADFVFARADVRQRCNILFKGKDVRVGEVIVKSKTVLGPTHLGLLAAGGISEVTVFKRPKIMIVATGSELIAPGECIAPGKVAASNLVTLVEELKIHGISAEQMIVRDNLENLQEVIEPLAGQYDLVLTCGGVLDGDKDFTMEAMDKVGVEPVFARVRIGPGKGTCFGRKGGTLFFNLPGGPPSNHVSFLLLVMPTVLRLSAMSAKPALFARLTQTISGNKGWTQVYYAHLGVDPGRHELTVTPVLHHSRLQVMAEADCLLEISEHDNELQAGTIHKIWQFR